LVVVNAKDDACPPRHSRDFLQNLASTQKESHTIAGANHYFSGSQGRGQLDEAVSCVEGWLNRCDFSANAEQTTESAINGVPASNL
jgi:hypothetical protein